MQMSIAVNKVIISLFLENLYSSTLQILEEGNLFPKRCYQQQEYVTKRSYFVTRRYEPKWIYTKKTIPQRSTAFRE